MNLELPSGITDLGRLVEVLNDRLRRVAEAFSAPFRAKADIDMAGNRVINLGDARRPTDALSLGMADRRYLTATGAAQFISNSQTSISQNTTIQGGGAGGSLVVLSVPGTLSIRSSAAPLLQLPSARNVSLVRALLKQPPTGAAVALSLKVGTGEVAALSIAANQVSASVNTLGKSIAANTSITLDITSVGTSFPGSDLTVLAVLA